MLNNVLKYLFMSNLTSVNKIIGPKLNYFNIRIGF